MRGHLAIPGLVRSLVALLVVGLCALGAAEDQPADPFAGGVALVYGIKGEVKAAAPKKDDAPSAAEDRALKRGDVLNAGEVVRVAKEAKARILYRDGKLVTIGAEQTHTVGTPAKEATSPLWEAVAAKFRHLASKHAEMSNVGAVRGGENPRLPQLAPIAPLASWILEDRPVFRWVPVKDATVYRHSLEIRAEDGSWIPVWQDLEWHEASMPFPYARAPLSAGIYRWRVSATVREKKFKSLPLPQPAEGAEKKEAATDPEAKEQTAAPDEEEEWVETKLDSGETGYSFSLPPLEKQREARAAMAEAVAQLPNDLDAFEREMLIGALWERKGIFVYDRAAEQYQRALDVRMGDIDAAKALVELYARIGFIVRR